VLEEPLHQNTRLELGITAVVTVEAAHPWQLPVAGWDGSACTVAGGTAIAGVFDELDQLTLILDASGSGKITVMLKLAHELLRRANADPLAPIPVVLMLSVGARGKDSLSDWIVYEVATRYEIPAA
jgi:eukaryotic-like serine/threonine-protein kinase